MSTDSANTGPMRPRLDPEHTYLTPIKAADFFQVSLSTFRRKRHAWGIEAIRSMNGKPVYRLADLQRAMERERARQRRSPGTAVSHGVMDDDFWTAFRRRGSRKGA
jgi:hypothetical protein